jgi:hypothetical protein
MIAITVSSPGPVSASITAQIVDAPIPVPGPARYRPQQRLTARSRYWRSAPPAGGCSAVALSRRPVRVARGLVRPVDDGLRLVGEAGQAGYLGVGQVLGYLGGVDVGAQVTRVRRAWDDDDNQGAIPLRPTETALLSDWLRQLAR